jgi:hypothetical protein
MATEPRGAAPSPEDAVDEAAKAIPALLRLQDQFAMFTAVSIVAIAAWAWSGLEKLFWPIFVMAPWGGWLLVKWQRAREHVPTPLPMAPRRAPGAAGVESLCAILRAHGRARLADALAAGAKHASALATYRETLGALDGEQESAREEAEDLRRQARDASESKAREHFMAGAETAARRVNRLEALRGEYELATARTESYRQIVKLLEADIARLQVRRTMEDALARIDAMAESVEGEVASLVAAGERLRARSDAEGA